MKRKQYSAENPANQTVAGKLKFKSGSKSIQIGFTEQKISPHAGSAAFWAFLHPRGFIDLLGACLPHPQPLSNNRILPVHKALSFLHGILCGAQRVTHCAYLRRDPVAPEILGVKRLASQSVLSRFFGGFTSAGGNLSCFRPLWRWCMEQLPSRREGYSLDLDSTRLLHEDGRQEGVKAGYTRMGIKPCLHPLLAVLCEVKMVANFWLRPGNSACASNVTAFLLDLLDNLPSWIRIRVVRADSGFCEGAFLDLLDTQGLRYIVVARLMRPLRSLITAGLDWQETEAAGICAAEVWHKEKTWRTPRRLILLRHQIREDRRTGGKKLIDVPGYLFQALVTNHPTHVRPIEVWRDYNQRADCENVIKELDWGFALPKIICKKFWATEAALSLAVIAYNLTVLFQRHLGWTKKVTVQTLRYWLFVNAGIISHPGGQPLVKLAVPPREREWWTRLWEKILSPFPNCNAVEPRPPAP